MIGQLWTLHKLSSRGGQRKSESANVKVVCGFTPLIKPILKISNCYFKIEVFYRKGFIDKQAIEIFPLSFSDMQAQGDKSKKLFFLNIEPAGSSAGTLALQIPLDSNVV